MIKSILVTGGNSGIGFALSKQLVMDHGCHVFLGARSQQRGQEAVKRIVEAMSSTSGGSGQVEFVQVDTMSDESVAAAAETIKSKTGGTPLYAVVNNAGTGLNHGVGPDQVVDTNLFGPKRVCDAFMDLLNPTEGRIVNVGSGAGPMYVANCDVEVKKRLCDPMVEWGWIVEHAKTALGSEADTMSGYGLSKAFLACYSAVLAREHPSIISSCVTPGFIDTPMTKGWGATKPPEDGTISIMHCLFQQLDGNGWFYGSDAKRSPLHYMRNPGEPAFDGKYPF